MTTSAYRMVYVTFDREEEARRVAGTLVEERLAACANLRGAGTSIYTWNDAVQHAQEWVLLLKTTAAQLPALKARIVELHSYDTPCVLAWEITEGHAPFLAWIDEMTAPPATS